MRIKQGRSAKAFGWLAAALLAACGGPSAGAGPSAHPTGSTPSASPSLRSTTAVFDLLPPPGGPPAIDLGITCGRPIGATDPVAVVQLHDGTVVLRDYADVAHPVT